MFIGEEIFKDFVLNFVVVELGMLDIIKLYFEFI